MIAILFLLLVFFHGLVLAKILLPKTNSFIKLSGGFLFGSIISVSSVYWVACLFHSLDLSLVLFFFFSIQLLLIFKKQYVQTIQIFQEMRRIDFGVCFVFFLFSLYLFSKTFGYDSVHGNFLVASNVYLDFGAHIPFIRSFSMGNNFPGEVPFFQNSGLQYYFLFDFFAGILEHIGMRIDIAYNFLSSISFTLLIILIYQLALFVFKRKSVGILSVIFFVFPSSLSFLTFFQKYGLNVHTIPNWWHNNFYYEGLPTILNKTIAVAQFWNLNPYMNQRHLLFGAVFFLFFVFLYITQKKITAWLTIVIGLCLGFLVMWHTMIFLAVFMVSPILFLLYPSVRKQLLIMLLIAGIVGLPQLYAIKLHSASTILFIPGFLLEHHITLKNELIFWFVNLGFGFFTICTGFLLGSKEQKKFFFVFLPLFLIPNLIHLSSRYTFDDHKYFSVWIIGAGMFSALCIVKLFAKNIYFKILAVALFVLLTLSGIISIMVIKNDIVTTLPDYPKSAFLTYAKQYIPNNAVTLTNGEIYDPLTLIGKKIFIGRVYYVFVYGADANDRTKVQVRILQPISRKDMINAIQKNKLQYLVLYKNNFAKNEKLFNEKFYGSFIKLYEDGDGTIYKI